VSRRVRAPRQLGIAEAPLHGGAVNEPTPGHLLTWKFAFGYEGAHALKGQSEQAGSVSGRNGVVQ
jgi:hypothetical protein